MQNMTDDRKSCGWCVQVFIFCDNGGVAYVVCDIFFSSKFFRNLQSVFHRRNKVKTERQCLGKLIQRIFNRLT